MKAMQQKFAASFSPDVDSEEDEDEEEGEGEGWQGGGGSREGEEEEGEGGDAMEVDREALAQHPHTAGQEGVLLSSAGGSGKGSGADAGGGGAGRAKRGGAKEGGDRRAGGASQCPSCALCGEGYGGPTSSPLCFIAFAQVGGWASE